MHIAKVVKLIGDCDDRAVCQRDLEVIALPLQAREPALNLQNVVAGTTRERNITSKVATNADDIVINTQINIDSPRRTGEENKVLATLITNNIRATARGDVTLTSAANQNVVAITAINLLIISKGIEKYFL